MEWLKKVISSGQRLIQNILMDLTECLVMGALEARITEAATKLGDPQACLERAQFS
jgi:hypothetical protein